MFRNRIDSNLARFLSTCISDTVESHFQEFQSPFRRQEVATSPNELQSQQANVGSPDDQMYCKQGLVCAVPNKCKTENPELALQSSNELDYGPGGDFAEAIQPSYLDQDSSMCRTLPWNASQISGFNLDSQEVINLGILQETLPEGGGGCISLNSFSGLEAEELTEEVTARDGLFADNAGENEQRLDFQSIKSRYEALKNTFPENWESPSRKHIPRARSEFSLTPTRLETNDMFSPLGKPYALDAEHGKKLSHMTLVERMASLSPLDVFSPVRPRNRSSRQHQGDDSLCNMNG